MPRMQTAVEGQLIRDDHLLDAAAGDRRVPESRAAKQAFVDRLGDARPKDQRVDLRPPAENQLIE